MDRPIPIRAHFIRLGNVEGSLRLVGSVLSQMSYCRCEQEVPGCSVMCHLTGENQSIHRCPIVAIQQFADAALAEIN